MQDLEFRQFVERLKLRAPIEEVVRERVPELKKRGALWQARCPFHDERTPSFTVDPRRGTWHCWGACSEGGDVIGFLERFEGVGFMDALRILAQSTGEQMPERLLERRRRGGESKIEERYDVLRRAERLYRKAFLAEEGAEARAYVADRGLSPETLELFGVGWAPREGSPLLAAARDAKVRPELLVETGLVKRADDGRAYDFFRGRLMIPIRDRMGRTVGFGGRVLPADEARGDGRPQAKYVNTPETALFLKGRLIFGLDLAIADVRRSKHLVLVEGYTDVMALHQAGCRSAAAVLGTATTSDHAALVRRSGAKRVTLLFDGDEAGR
ncbi:MAG TPA: DNA primase, partial [Planctomycetes bacterium]|nr:DNA primase [Planctomycetota bacterium]